MVITATQIKIKSIAGLFRFFPRVREIKKQLASSNGIVFFKFKGSRTLTAWESHEDMKAFRNSGPHLEAMKNTRRIGKAKSITWDAHEEPGWEEAIKKLKDVPF